jgi:hypothetical protein
MDGSTLSLAVKANQVDLVNLLLAKGAKPDGLCLNYTVDSGNQQLFDLLIKAGADASHGNLFRCIQKGRVYMAKVFLDHGSNPQPLPAMENRGNVYWAIYYDQPEILKMLLDHGADPEIKSAYNETPLSRAKEQHPEMVPMIEEAIKRRHGGVMPTNSTHP